MGEIWCESIRSIRARPNVPLMHSRIRGENSIYINDLTVVRGWKWKSLGLKATPRRWGVAPNINLNSFFFFRKSQWHSNGGHQSSFIISDEKDDKWIASWRKHRQTKKKWIKSNCSPKNVWCRRTISLSQNLSFGRRKIDKMTDWWMKYSSLPEIAYLIDSYRAHTHSLIRRRSTGRKCERQQFAVMETDSQQLRDAKMWMSRMLSNERPQMRNFPLDFMGCSFVHSFIHSARDECQSDAFRFA